MNQLIYEELLSKSDNIHMINRYIKFITTFGNTGGTIQHHILPKSKDCFPQYKDFKTNEWNKCLLTPRQHFVSHWMLWKILGGSQTFSFYQMKNKNGEKLNSKVYENLLNERTEYYRTEKFRKEQSERTKQQHRDGKGGMLNKTQSTHQRQVVSKLFKGVPKNPESVEKQRKSLLRTINDPNYKRPYTQTEEHKQKSIQNLPKNQKGENNGNSKSVEYNGKIYGTMKECSLDNNISMYKLRQLMTTSNNQ